MAKSGGKRQPVKKLQICSENAGSIAYILYAGNRGAKTHTGGSIQKRRMDESSSPLVLQHANRGFGGASPPNSPPKAGELGKQAFQCSSLKQLEQRRKTQMRISRKLGNNPRAMGTNPRALELHPPAPLRKKEPRQKWYAGKRFWDDHIEVAFDTWENVKHLFQNENHSRCRGFWRKEDAEAWVNALPHLSSFSRHRD